MVWTLNSPAALAAVRARQAEVAEATARVQDARLAGRDPSASELALATKSLELALTEMRLHDLFDTLYDESGH
jgi:hypothetical protein